MHKELIQKNHYGKRSNCFQSNYSKRNLMNEMYIQPDMFDNSEIGFLKTIIEHCIAETKTVRARSDNVRRGLFARHNELEKRIQSLEEENINLKNCLLELKSVVEGLRVESQYLLMA